MKSIHSFLLLLAAATGCTMTQKDKYDPSEHDPWVIRTFRDRDELWESLRKRIAAPVGPDGFLANVRFVDDSKFYGLAGVELVHALPDDYPGGFCFVVDGSISSQNEDIVTLLYFHPESLNPADYERPPSATPTGDVQSVRILPHVVQEIENNLSIANIDMHDVHNGVPEDGIYRGIDF